METIFNHDGFNLLDELSRTDCTARDADRVLVEPLAKRGFAAIDWSLITTGAHNCRTRHKRLVTRAMLERMHAGNPAMWGSEVPRILSIGDTVERYAAQPKDLLDCVIAAAHARGMKVFGCVRLNHANALLQLEGVPGRAHCGGQRKDFRDESFHGYLAEIYEDLLEKGVDGLSLDFERKAPFFPDDAPPTERFDACLSFLRRIRKITDKPVIARVSYDPAKGEPQGQKPLEWIRQGLLDAVVPATHNHEPDRLDWMPTAFIIAAAQSPRLCKVWPQIWPTRAEWTMDMAKRPMHSPEQIQKRLADLKTVGIDGVYLFNFCCYGPLERALGGVHWDGQAG